MTGGRRPSFPDFRMKGPPTVVARSGVQVSEEQLRSTGTIQTMAPKQAPSPPPTPRPLAEQDKKEVAEAEKVYQDLKKQVKANDLTPDIYLVSVYADYGQYGKMVQVIDVMLAQRPDDPNLKKLKAWARAQPSRQP